MTSFNDFVLAQPLLAALERMQYKAPTPIQAQTIPLALQGHDILGSAQTGTGKTGAFSIPIIDMLLRNKHHSALVITPTRELAKQIFELVNQIVPRQGGFRTALMIGGEPMPRQLRQLDMGPRLFIGTPGRINDHLNRGSLSLHNTYYLVLDETDRMLDMGFSVQIDDIIKHLPDERQTMLFSATLTPPIIKVANKYLSDPQRIAVGSTHTPVEKIVQEQIHVSASSKYAVLETSLAEREGAVIVFVKTQKAADRINEQLRASSYKSGVVHGGLHQRRRESALRDFRDKKYRILVATDVAARGLDVPHVAHVINYDLPQRVEDYIHRIGRTARAGAEGKALSIISPSDREIWGAIEHFLEYGEEKAPVRQGSGRWGKGGGNRRYGNNDYKRQSSYGSRPRKERY